MTNMKRVTIALPDSLDQQIINMRKEEQFLRCSYSEIVRKLLEQALAITDENAKTSA